MKNLLPFLLLLIFVNVQSQVKVGDNPNTINSNSILELESTNKGFLPPRIALNNASTIAPLTGTVPSGMLVYSSGGTLADGYYYWNGTSWRLVATAGLNTVAKTATVTLVKTETMVLASNNITITLPAITASDNGLEVSIKNIGSHSDLVKVKGAATSKIDDKDSAMLTRYKGNSFVASGGNWVIKDKTNSAENLLDVNHNSSWTNIQEALDFLALHMTGPTVLRLGETSYEVTATLTVDLPFPLTIMGLSYGVTTLVPESGLSGKPMFRCESDCFFKMLQFDATSGSYGTQPGEDAIRFLGSDTYNEVKDCYFERFYNTILDSSNAEVWVFETDIVNARNNGILVHGNVPGVTLKVAETDFIGCNYGINLSKGSAATLQLASGGYYNANAGDTAIFYQPSTFTSFSNISITGNSWNSTGKFIEGFDFTRTDGRDANATVENNTGIADKDPSCTMGVNNNTTATVLTAIASWYKITWVNTSSSTTKWLIGNNRITYQPNTKRDANIIISGNIQCSSATATINIGLVKNSAATSGTAAAIVRYGETTLRPGVVNQPFQFSLVVNLADIQPGDFFELWSNASIASTSVTVQDIQWLVTTQ